MGAHASRIQSTRLVAELEKSGGRGGVQADEIGQLQGLVLTVADMAGPQLDRIQQVFEQYTQHDLEHSRNVAEHMARIVPQATLEHLNGLELSLLLLAAILHDVGMVITPAEAEAITQSAEFRNFSQLSGTERLRAAQTSRGRGESWRARRIETTLIAEFARRHHASRVHDFVRRHLPNCLLFRAVSFATALGQLCESHAWPVEKSYQQGRSVTELPADCRFGGVPVNLRYLACLLRLSDILDFDRSRTPVLVFETSDFTDEASWEEWNKHLSIGGWKIDPTTIAFRAECSHPSFYVAVHALLDSIDQELQACRYLLDGLPAGIASRYELRLPVAVDRREVQMAEQNVLPGGLRFQLEYDEIINLLMDKSLYPDELLFLRELLQNALDACRRKEAEAKLVFRDEAPRHYQPRIMVLVLTDDHHEPRVEFLDNGIGMSQRIVEQYFLRIGKSYYRSTEFEALRVRYEQAGIQLDASSQFGIGVLSCFMVADRLRIETHQHGHEPLSMEVNGPSKYFIIRRLPEREQPQFESQPDRPEDDGPPYRTGTRVVVYLKDATRCSVRDAVRTLTTFAVNSDVTISIRGESLATSQLIPVRKWDAGPSNVASFLRESRRAYLSLTHDRGWLDVLLRHRIPLGRVNEGLTLAGSAWFWFLPNKLGQPCVERGYLRIRRCKDPQWQLDLRGPPAFVIAAGMPSGNVSFSDSVVADRVRDLLPFLEGGAEKPFLEMLKGKGGGGLKAREAQLTEARDRQWQNYSAVERSWIIDCLRSSLNTSKKEKTWHQDEHFRFLLEGVLDSSWKLNPITWRNLSIPCAYSIAVNSVLVPSRIQLWDPTSLQAHEPDLTDYCGAALLDVRGVSPRLSASRLFLPLEHAGGVITGYLSCVVAEALRLAVSHPGDLSWRGWVDESLRRVLDRASHYAAIEIFRRLFGAKAQQLGFKCWIEGRPEVLSWDELRQAFGSIAPVPERLSEGSRTSGLDRHDGVNRLVLAPRDRGDFDVGAVSLIAPI